MNTELSISGDRVEGELYDRPVAHELVELLPVELVFHDFNRVEKVAPLGRSLALRGVPSDGTTIRIAPSPAPTRKGKS